MSGRGDVMMTVYSLQRARNGPNADRVKDRKWPEDQRLNSRRVGATTDQQDLCQSQVFPSRVELKCHLREAFPDYPTSSSFPVILSYHLFIVFVVSTHHCLLLSYWFTALGCFLFCFANYLAKNLCKRVPVCLDHCFGPSAWDSASQTSHSWFNKCFNKYRYKQVLLGVLRTLE